MSIMKFGSCRLTKNSHDKYKNILILIISLAVVFGINYRLLAWLIGWLVDGLIDRNYS